MARMFGTDGVRGVANGPVLNAELAYRLGRAAAQYFGREVKTPKILIGRDTRLSGTMLESALPAGGLYPDGDWVQPGTGDPRTGYGHAVCETYRGQR